MSHEHKIQCEVCDKITSSGIIIKDNGLRDRYFCSKVCLNKKLNEQEEENKDKDNSPTFGFILFIGGLMGLCVGIMDYMFFSRVESIFLSTLFGLFLSCLFDILRGKKK